MKSKNPAPYINLDYFEDLTGDIARSQTGSFESVGARIRRIRETKGMSLTELASLTGFSTEKLAAIESDQFQPQLGTLIKLSKALESALGRVLSGVGDKLYTITRKGEHTVISRSTSEKDSKSLYTYMSLAPDVRGRHMEALLVRLDEAVDEQMSVHEGEEFIYVLQGDVVLKIGADTHELAPGDSAYYLSTTPHLLSAASDSATIVAVVYEG